ncbi:MAG: hypothetical protein D6737_06515 [Chloroflexi bacterium]|nr:MAG: hypothetical protein D6737_06515 [Chloroflexota bacterium]
MKSIGIFIMQYTLDCLYISNQIELCAPLKITRIESKDAKIAKKKQKFISVRYETKYQGCLKQ